MNTNQPTADQIEKIRKLLALAHDTGATEAESTSAFASASKLMTKWGIEAHQLGSGKAQAPTFQRASIEGAWRSKRPAHPFVRQIIRECFCVSIIRNQCAGVYTYYMIGTPADMAFATYAFEVLNDAFPRLYYAYLRKRGLEKTRALRNGYYWGLQAGFTKAWKDAQAAEVAAQGAQSYALVLVDKQALLTKTIAEDPDIRTPKAREIKADAEAFRSGVEEGKKLKVARPIAGGTPTESLR
jgi:hypothetical protein